MNAHQQPNKRQSVLRRNINDLFMRDGQVEEAKLWANIGKLLCCWLLVQYTEEVLKTEYTLLTLLLFIIMPDLIKKFMSMRFGGVPDKGGK